MVKFSLVKFFTSIVVPISVISAMGDEFMSCDRYYENRRESRVLEAIPCDMSKVSFCKHKGSSYPEAAIWRFKEENRALMRRLYGDMESSTVYREMKQLSDFADEDMDSSRSSIVLGSSGFMPDLFSSLESKYNIRMGSGLATVKNAKEPFVDTSDAEVPPPTKIKVKKKKIVRKQSTEPNVVSVETSTTTSTSSVFATTSEAPSPTTITTDESTKSPNPSTTMNSSPMTTQAPFDEVTVYESDDTTTIQDMAESKEESMDNTLSDLLNETNLDDLEQLVEEYLPEPEPLEYDDYDVKENLVDYSGESQHACPVYSEVIAPYWANNTRDQVLALLNLQPFEQYIHMEKCKFEHEEMLCRKGCRCEQQYRLHRLLAFDPNNECRGIFSDWFRFPSYCICKCYNVPQDFLPEQTSRKAKLESKSEPLKPESLINHTGMSQNIPAILPYEAKEALLRELSRKDRKMDTSPMDNGHFFYSAPVMDFNLANGQQGSIGQTPRKKK